MEFTRVQELLRYDPATGNIYWKVGKSNILAGSLAGRLRSDGYRTIKIDGRDYYSHRIAWLLVTGMWPEDQIDHKNGIRSDNRLENLRECNSFQNKQNEKKKARFAGIPPSSKLIGAWWNSKTEKWCSDITYYGNRVVLGSFDTEIEAHNAYKKAKLRFHDFNPVPRSGNSDELF